MTQHTGAGAQLVAKAGQGNHQARATMRVYGEESIEAMNQIAAAVGKRPSEIVAEWIAQVHAEMVDNGMIELKES